MVRYALTFSALASSVLGAVPTISIPLHYSHSFASDKIATFLVDPASSRSVEVVVDQGSENFWVFGPDSISNWGCTSLLCPGPCNVTVEPFYDYPKSPTASKPEAFASGYSYGGNTKILAGKYAVNDTFHFVSDAGLSSMIDTRVAIEYYMIQRLPESNNSCAKAPPYDHGILGISPFYHGAERNTTGPHVRQDLLEAGVISAPVQSLWFDEAPSGIDDDYTGNVVFGGIDHSKYTGDLVKLDLTNSSFGATIGYYVDVPTASVNGISFNKTGISSTSCLIDSGTSQDSLPINEGDYTAFAAAAGIAITSSGLPVWNGTCESIPKDITIDLTFTGQEGKTVTVKVPLRNYAFTGEGEPASPCTLSLNQNDCLLGAPFATAAFFAANDAENVVAFAQGGVSKKGSKPDPDSITLDF